VRTINKQQEPLDSVLSEVLYPHIDHASEDFLETKELFEEDEMQNIYARLEVDHSQGKEHKYSILFLQPGKTKYEESETTEGYWNVWELDEYVDPIMGLDEEVKRKFKHKLVLEWSTSFVHFTDHLGEGYYIVFRDDQNPSYFSVSKENALWSGLAQRANLENNSKKPAPDQFKRYLVNYILSLSDIWAKYTKCLVVSLKLMRWRASMIPSYNLSPELLQTFREWSYLPVWIIDNLLIPLGLTESLLSTAASKIPNSTLLRSFHAFYARRNLVDIQIQDFDKLQLSDKELKELLEDLSDHMDMVEEEDSDFGEDDANESEDEDEDEG